VAVGSAVVCIRAAYKLGTYLRLNDGTVVATTIGAATYSFSNVDGSQNAFEAR